MAHETSTPAKLAKECAFADMVESGLSPNASLMWEKELGIRFSMITLRRDYAKSRKGIFCGTELA